MEKIPLAINPENININTIDFACYVAKLSPSKLAAIFLENATSVQVPVPKNDFEGAYFETVVASDSDKIIIDIQQQHNVHALKCLCNQGNPAVK